MSRSEWLVRRAGGGVVLIGVDVLVCWFTLFTTNELNRKSSQTVSKASTHTTCSVTTSHSTRHVLSTSSQTRLSPTAKSSVSRGHFQSCNTSTVDRSLRWTGNLPVDRDLAHCWQVEHSIERTTPRWLTCKPWHRSFPCSQISLSIPGISGYWTS